MWFDYPRLVCVWRAARRVLTTYGRVRPDLALGCPEKFDWEFLRFVWEFNDKSRPQIVIMLEEHGRHLDPVMFRRDGDVVRFLDDLPAN